MKLSFLSIPVLAFIITACNYSNTIIPSEEIIEFKIPIDDIDALDVSGIYEVAIRIGDEEKLKIRCNENLKEYLDISDKGKTISLDMDNVSAPSSIVLEAIITVNSLDRIDCSGAVRVNLEKGDYENIDIDLSGVSSVRGKDIIAKNITADASGAGLLNLSGLSARKITIDASGASTFKLAGTVDDIFVDFSGASQLMAKDLVVQKSAKLDGSGASGFNINVLGTISADLSGASRLVYAGNPTKVSKSLSGASTVSAE